MLVPEHIGVIEICRKEPVNHNSSDSELIAVALMATNYFRDNIDHTISFVKCTNLPPGCYHDIDGMKNMFFDLLFENKISAEI